MKYRKTAAGVIVGLGVATVGFASASLLNLDATAIQHGTSSVTAQESTVQTDWGLETTPNGVSSVKFKNFDEAANGAEFFVRVYDNNGGLIKADKFVVTVGGTPGTQGIALPAGTLPQNIGSVEAWLEG